MANRNEQKKNTGSFIAQQDQRIQPQHHFEIQLAGTLRRGIRQEQREDAKQKELAAVISSGILVSEMSL